MEATAGESIGTAAGSLLIMLCEHAKKPASRILCCETELSAPVCTLLRKPIQKVCYTESLERDYIDRAALVSDSGGTDVGGDRNYVGRVGKS